MSVNLTLPSLSLSQRIVNTSSGLPDPAFAQSFNNTITMLVQSISNLDNVVTEMTGVSTSLTSAQTAITTAQTTATGAATQAAALAAQVSLANSFAIPSTNLSATANTTAATVSIAATVRHYFDGSTAAVSAGSIGNLALSTTYWVYYSDPSHAGGAVTYQASTTASDAAQLNGVHCVGKIVTPTASSTSTGAGWGGPGVPL